MEGQNSPGSRMWNRTIWPLRTGSLMETGPSLWSQAEMQSGGGSCEEDARETEAPTAVGARESASDERASQCRVQSRGKRLRGKRRRDTTQAWALLGGF